MSKKQVHLTPNQIKQQMKRKRELAKAFEEDRELLKSLVGRKVKLNQEAYQPQIDRHELGVKFLIWYEDNKDNEFEIESVYKDYLLVLKGAETWLFSLSSLIVMED